MRTHEPTKAFQAKCQGSLEKMKQDFELSKSDLQKGLQGIRAAMDQLQTYYGGPAMRGGHWLPVRQNPAFET